MAILPSFWQKMMLSRGIHKNQCTQVFLRKCIFSGLNVSSFASHPDNQFISCMCVCKVCPFSLENDPSAIYTSLKSIFHSPSLNTFSKKLFTIGLRLWVNGNAMFYETFIEKK